MAKKNKPSDDADRAEAEAKARAAAGNAPAAAQVEPADVTCVGMELKYKPGRLEQAIQNLFAEEAGADGIVVRMAACGCSLRFPTPESFPRTMRRCPCNRGNHIAVKLMEID
jgi:hypothetical protein